MNRRARHALAALAIASASLGHGAPWARAQHPGLAASEEPAPPLFEGLGNWTHPTSTKKPEAQRYFDQGLRLYFAFNHEESRRSFQRAAEIDPTFALAPWGVALCLGSNYNLAATPEQLTAAHDALDEAQQLSAGALPAEQALIEALAKRYSRDPKADPATLQQTYAQAMADLARAFPDDVDIAVLSVEARMNLRPWDLWTRDRKPQPGTEAIVADLERVLERSPEHAGAIHYYIHAVEASPYPERAKAVADRLGALTPAAGHLVHMPAHIYLQFGDYSAAADANVRAIAADEAYLAGRKPGIYGQMYYPHNIHFLWWTRCIAGQSREAEAAAQKLAGLLTPEVVREMPMVELFLPIGLATQVRFGRWAEILYSPEPPEELRYLNGFWHYARGMAFVRQGGGDEARRELGILSAQVEALPADWKLMRHAPRELLGIARAALTGQIAAYSQQFDLAERELRRAVALQDGLADDEPPPWFYPVRQSLGAVLLEAGEPSKAETAYGEDLARHPKNGWSLLGRMQALEKLGRLHEAAKAEEAFRDAWREADVQITASVF